MFIAQVLVGSSIHLKQMIRIVNNIVKNPNWLEANQLAIYKRGTGFELGSEDEKQIQVVVRAALEPGTAGLWVRHADHSATLPLKSERRGPEAAKFKDLLLEAWHVILGHSSAPNTSAPKPCEALAAEGLTQRTHTIDSGDVWIMISGLQSSWGNEDGDCKDWGTSLDTVPRES